MEAGNDHGGGCAWFVVYGSSLVHATRDGERCGDAVHDMTVSSVIQYSALHDCESDTPFFTDSKVPRYHSTATPLVVWQLAIETPPGEMPGVRCAVPLQDSQPFSLHHQSSPPPSSTLLYSPMAEGSNFDYLFKVCGCFSSAGPMFIRTLSQVVLIGDSGVGKSSVSRRSLVLFPTHGCCAVR